MKLSPGLIVPLKEIEYGFGYIIYVKIPIYPMFYYLNMALGDFNKIPIYLIFYLLEYGFGYIIIRSSYTPDFIYLRGTIALSMAKDSGNPDLAMLYIGQLGRLQTSLDRSQLLRPLAGSSLWQRPVLRTHLDTLEGRAFACGEYSKFKFINWRHCLRIAFIAAWAYKTHAT